MENGKRSFSRWAGNFKSGEFCMQKLFFSCALVLTLAIGGLFAQETPLIGVVNFTTCLTDSKYGKKEQESIEAMQKQMASLVETTEKELKELAAKFEDPDYLDSLSPKAEEEQKLKYQTLQEDFARYQNQYCQVLNRANYQMIQKLNSTIAAAAEKVAQERHLDYVMNRDVCFYIRPDLEITASVIDEMDKRFDLDSKLKKLADNSEEAPTVAQQEEEALLLDAQAE
jgi:outer membrane protein